MNQLKEYLIWIVLGIPGMVLIGLVLHSLVHFERFEIYFNSGITYGADNLELLHVTKHEIDLTVQRGGVIFQDVLKDWSIEPDATIHVWRFSESESDVMTSEFSLFMLGLLAKIKAGTIWKSSLFILSCLSDHQV